jgi:3-hydroxyisobutyrate dehydrogenase-like beta-hydroxyacid dehydrogenase
MLGDEGLLAAVDSSNPPLVAIMSTVLPQTIEAVGDASRDKGVRLVDAPVSGLPVVAEQGKLAIMVGGQVADLELMRPVLEAMGENIFHAGPLGSGEVTKIVNNIVGVTNLFLAVEAMRVGRAYGMDLHRLAAVMEVGSGRNFSTQDWERAKATFAYFAKSPSLMRVAVDLCRKDLSHAQELARQEDVSCPLLDKIADGVRGFGYDETQRHWREVSESQ